MKILITGSSGFLGRHLIRHLMEKKLENVTIFGLFHLSKLGSLPFRDSCTYLRANIHDPDMLSLIMEDIHPDAVIHLSGLLRGSLHDLLMTNVEGWANLLEASRRAGVESRIVYVSSSAVYGYVGDQPISETQIPMPVSTYGISKLAGEHLAKQYFLRYHMPVCIIRPFNLIGPGQSEDYITGSLVKQAVRVIKKKQNEVVIRSIKGRRDFIDVRDVARGLSDIITNVDNSKRFSGDIFNFGSEKEYSIMDLIDTIGRIGGKNIPVRVTNPEEEEIIPTQISDCSKIHALSDWRSSFCLEQSLGDMMYLEMNQNPKRNKS